MIIIQGLLIMFLCGFDKSEHIQGITGYIFIRSLFPADMICLNKMTQNPYRL